MKDTLEIILNDSLLQLKNRNSEDSFLGMLLYNFSTENVLSLKKHLQHLFDEKIKEKYTLLNNSNSKTYEYSRLYEAKTKNKKSILVILDPYSKIIQNPEIKRNCFSIDIDYFKKV